MGTRGKTGLLIVHPASTCGSADFSLGPDKAARDRAGLVATIEEWRGPSVIIDNDLDAELTAYESLDIALRSLNEPIRVNACATESGWIPDAFAAIEKTGLRHFIVTGAWHHPGDHSGCIDAITSMMDQRDMQWEIASCAFRI